MLSVLIQCCLYVGESFSAPSSPASETLVESQSLGSAWLPEDGGRGNFSVDNKKSKHGKIKC